MLQVFQIKLPYAFLIIPMPDAFNHLQDLILLSDHSFEGSVY
jgi:hypothetical protein